MAAKIDYAKLGTAIQRARGVLRVPRQNRVEIAREVAGHRYSEGGTAHRVKLNLLSLYQTIIGGSLIAQDPRYLLNASGDVPRSRLRTEQDWLNEQVVRIGLAGTLKRALIDALYCQGKLKIAVTSPCDAANSAWGVTAGEPGAWVIDLDDYVFDVACKDPAEFTFEGHRYRCPVDVAKKMYGSKAKDLSAEGSLDRDFNRDGDERIGRLLSGYQQWEEFEDHVELWEIYLPRHRRVVTLADRDVMFGRGGVVKPLWEQPWVGHPRGPYPTLVLGTVPGQALGKGPMTDLYELHMDHNNVARKMNNMVRRLKELTVFQRRNDQDAKELGRASDGDFVPLDEPDKIQNLVSGGNALQALTLMAVGYKDAFSFMGGNLELIGGRSAQSRTATQDKLLEENSGAGLAVLQRATQAFVADAGERLLWLSHYHPELVMESDLRVPGTAISIPRKLHPPGHPQGRNWTMNQAKFRLDPYSLAHKSPQERLSFLDAAVQQILPIMPLLQQQGLAFDVNAWLRFRAEYGDAPELTEMFTVRPPAVDDTGSQGAAETPHTQTLPAQTERTYTRRNVPQDRGGQSQQMLAHMAGIGLGGSPTSLPSMNGSR